MINEVKLTPHIVKMSSIWVINGATKSTWVTLTQHVFCPICTQHRVAKCVVFKPAIFRV